MQYVHIVFVGLAQHAFQHCKIYNHVSFWELFSSTFSHSFILMLSIRLCMYDSTYHINTEHSSKEEQQLFFYWRY